MVSGVSQRNDHWIKAYDHNHLRITRAIKSLRLLVSKETAEEFLNSVFDIAGDRVNVVRQDAIGFWKSGVNKDGKNLLVAGAFSVRRPSNVSGKKRTCRPPNKTHSSIKSALQDQPANIPVWITPQV